MIGQQLVRTAAPLVRKGLQVRGVSAIAGKFRIFFNWFFISHNSAFRSTNEPRSIRRKY